jgi:hypothetical protein
VVVVGSGSNSVTLTGTLVQINDLLAGNLTATIAYLINSDTPPASDTLTLSINDGGNTGAGGPLAANDTATINITAVNDAPVNTVPASIAVTEDVASPITGISIADVDAGASSVLVTLSVPSGTLAAVSGGGVVVGGSGSGTLTLTGSVANINIFIAASSVTFTTALNDTSSVGLTVTTDDQGNTPGPALNDVDVVTLSVTAVNDGPSATIVPASYAATEQVSLALHGTGLSVADVDAGGANVTATLSVVSGTLTVGAGTTGVVVVGSGSNSVTLTGTIAQINDLLAGNLTATISYLINSDTPPASDTLTLSINDGGNTGAGGPLAANDTATINIAAVNDAPSATIAPASYAATEQVNLTLHGTGLSVGDVDAGGANVTATLSVVSGTLTVGAGTTGVVVVGSGSNSVTLTGTLVQINDLLAGNLTATIAYLINSDTPPASDTLTLSIDDGGNTGAGGPLSANDTATINITATNDAPVNTVPGAGAALEDVPTAVTGISIADADAGAGSVLVTLSVPSGTLAAASGGGVVVGGSGSGALTLTGTVSDINTFIAGSNVTFTTAPNAAANVALTVTTDDQGNTPAPAQTDTDAFTIVVTAVNDAPAGTDGAVTVNEDATYTFAASDFGFTDPNDAPANAFLAVRIASLPGAGTLFHTVNGPVGLGTVVSVADIGAGLLRYTPPADANGAAYASFTFQVQDDGGLLNGGADTDASPNTLTLNVTALNDAPVNTVPGAQGTPEDTTLVFSTVNGNRVSVADVDAGAGLVDVTLTVTNGTLTLAGTAGLAFIAGGDGTATMTVRGTTADINAALDGMSYAPTLNYTGPATLTILTDDRGNTGAGGALTDADVVNIAVAAANDAPVNTVPAAQATNEDTALVFSAGTGNAVLIADLDAGLANVQVQLTVTNGTLTLGGVGGLAFVAGADGTATMTVQGTIAAINAAMDGMTYAPAANFNGPATLTITTDDLGNTGAGGALADTDVVNIIVNAVNDAPVNAVPGAQTGNEDVPLALAGLAVSDVDGGPVEVMLGVANGRLDVSLAGGATIAAGANGSGTLTLAGTQAQVNAALATLAYTGAANWSGADTLTMTTTDLGNFGAGGALGDVDTVALTINPVNDAPALGANAFLIREGETVVLGSTNLSATDIDDAAGGLTFIVGGVTNGHFALASNPGAAITSFTQAQVVAGQIVFVHSGDTPAFTITVFDGTAAVGPQAANIIFNGGGGTTTPPPGSGGGGGSGTTVTPPELPPVTPATPAPQRFPGEAGFFGGAGRGGGDDGGSGAVFVQEAAVVAPTNQGVTRTDRVGGAEVTGPPVRIQAEGIDTNALRRDVEVEPVRAEMQILPTRGGLGLAEDDPERQQIEIVMNSVRITGMALSVGAIWWAARAAGLVASLLASTPAWRHVDPLPVLGRDDEDEEEEVWDEASAEEQERRDDEHRASWVLEDSKLPS